ncbi:hypothetical protein ACN47E_007379 [Coniothyrium glycines]
MTPRLLPHSQIRLCQTCSTRVWLVPKAVRQRASLHTSADQVFSQKISSNRKADRVFQSLPLIDLVRTLSVLSVAALPAPILTSIIRLIRKNSTRIASSRILSWPLRKTFYDTFCIGESKPEIAANISALRSRGITGVVLSFAREAKLDGSTGHATAAQNAAQLRDWVSANIETITQVGSGDYIAIKLTGAGAAAVKAMEDFHAANPTYRAFQPDTKVDSSSLDALRSALFEICEAAEKHNVKMMVDAESSHHQAAIDYLTLEAMAAYNQNDRALVSNTYQMYLKSGLETLASHLRIASAKGYVAGVKLVRGAYLKVEPARAATIHESKEATDNCFDEAVDMLLRSTKTTGDQSQNPWTAEVMLASHNTRSVEKALALYGAHRDLPGAQVQRLVFAQLMGMADEITMKLAKHNTSAKAIESTSSMDNLVAKKQLERSDKGVSVYKYTVWGSFEDCLLYMLRRAEENQDAVARSRATAGLMLKELAYRMAFWK